MDTVLICGGFLEEETAKKVLEKIKPDCIIGIDRGLEFCYRNQIYPQYILGDFDSVDKRILDFYENQKEIPVQRYKPEKDATDARIGLELALKLGRGFFYWVLQEEGWIIIWEICSLYKYP